MNENWIPFEIGIEAGTGEEGFINLMPEEDQDILICTKSGNVQFDTMEYDCDGYYLDSGYGIGDEVIAWMPLPEPYRKDDEDEIDLCEYVSRMAQHKGCCHTAKEIMGGACAECDCELAVLYISAVQAAELRDHLMIYEDTGLTPDQILQLKKECDWYCIVGEVVREVENKLERIKNKNECLKKLLELALQEIERIYELNSSIKIVTFKLPEIKFDLTLDENDIGNVRMTLRRF